ncbi:hypothetical protein NLU13_1690 [Sarocladium strictum]|uniref:Nucleolar protein 12 n=1 Tax=Sarocladium strictum TaxID=5046 RepID=A0AA39LCI1_SARSR|nr:hypothetical protein NLU13_1690 [Sarocladium strictum]
MFAKPRAKKPLLPPPNKRRKTTSAVEEVNFDFDARQEYLTGFHKRKQQRIKNAQEEAAKRERQERLETRRQAREDRKREVEEHVQTVNRLLRESGAIPAESPDSGEEEGAEDEWEGIPDPPSLDIVDQEEEYIDEDRYTTVTVESVAVSKDGFEKPPQPGDAEIEENDGKKEAEDGKDESKPNLPKKRKKKFRYETKIERQLTETKRKIKSRAKRA